jgi:hypothetical protein
MSTRNLLIIVVSLAALIAGCASDKKPYQVTVENRFDRPVTVWLTQSHESRDAQWMSPETMAIHSPRMRDSANRVVVPPGKTASTSELKARLASDTDAVLRIYIGERSFDELLAMSRDNPNRFDVVLKPGRNELVLREEDGRLVADRGSAMRATAGEPTTAPGN